MKKARKMKTRDWNEKELDAVLKMLKAGKAQDASGMVNEIFMSKNIGRDLKMSLLLLLNKIQIQMKNPDFINDANIISISKVKVRRP